MNLDERLEGILRKYSISYVDKSLETKIISLLNRMILELPDSKTISIRGAGNHTKELLKVLNKESKVKIKFISADKVGEDSLDGIRIVPVKDEKAQTDVVIISSFFYRNEMMQDIIKQNKGAEIIDIYDFLSKNGVELTMEFFYYIEMPRNTKCYRMIAECMRKYSCEREKRLRQKYLRNLVGMYIYIRDFESFFQYVDIYVGERFEHWEDYQNCKEEIEQILAEISWKIKNSKYHHIIVNWIDALRYDELSYMPKLAGEVEKGAFFENAYTVTPFTSVTMQMMFKNKYVVNDKLYRKTPITESNSVVLKKLKEEGYSFCYIGASKIGDMFEWKKRYGEEVLDVDTCAPYIQWLALKKLYAAEQKLCLLLHYIPETHVPFDSGYTSDIFFGLDQRVPIHKVKKNRLWSRQCEECRLYIDDKLDDFLNFIGRNKNTIVYLSDHGKFPSNEGRMICADVLHVCFAVVSPYIKQCRVRKVFSLIDFIRIIEWITEAEKGNVAIRENVFSDYSIIQDLDVYDVHTAEYLLKYYREKGDLQLLKECCQSRGLITPNELFIKYSDGDMRYYLLPDEETNHIDDEKYRDRVNELKSIEMAPFINPYEDDDFAAARILYDYIKEKEKERIE